jgi:hypothetical protein
MKVKKLEKVRPTSPGSECILVFVPIFGRWASRINVQWWNFRRLELAGSDEVWTGVAKGETI